MVKDNIWRIQTKKNVNAIKSNIKKNNYNLIFEEKDGGYNYLWFDTKGEKPSVEFWQKNKKLANGTDVYLLKSSERNLEMARGSPKENYLGNNTGGYDK